VQLNCTFFQNSKLRLMEYAGIPEDFARLGVEFGQKVAAMPDARAAMVLGTTDGNFDKFLDGFVCGNENVVVFGAMTGTVKDIGTGSSIITGALLGESNDKYYLVGSELMSRGIVVVVFCGESLGVRADYVLGWKPIGKEMVITETLGNNVISTLDNMPAENPETPVMAAVKGLLDTFLATHDDIDTKRLYIMGLSMGAMATFDMVTRYPETITCGVQISWPGVLTNAAT
jgi:hypothetical protein